MKTPILKPMISVVISILVSASALCCALILSSRGFVNSKYGIVIIIVGAIGYLTVKLLNGAEKSIADQYKNDLVEEIRLRKEYAQENITLEEENKKLKLEIERLGKEPETESEYQSKYSRLKSFQDSFPYVIDPLLVVYNILRTELCVGKYSRWMIVGEADGELFVCTVLRPDVQEYKGMLDLVKNSKTIDDISQIDQSRTLICE